MSDTFKTKALKQVNAFFTEKQMSFLEREKEETSESYVTIIRIALNHYKNYKEKENKNENK